MFINVLTLRFSLLRFHSVYLPVFLPSYLTFLYQCTCVFVSGSIDLDVYFPLTLMIPLDFCKCYLRRRNKQIESKLLIQILWHLLFVKQNNMKTTHRGKLFARCTMCLPCYAYFLKKHSLLLSSYLSFCFVQSTFPDCLFMSLSRFILNVMFLNACKMIKRKRIWETLKRKSVCLSSYPQVDV